MAFTDIDNPELHFQIKTYTGNGTAIGSGGQAITLDGDEDMQPDLVWIKDRTDSDRPRLFDAVRGVTKELDTSDTTGETTLTEGLTTFGSDGFTVGNHEGVNSSSDNFVAWCWKESADAGFDMVSYTGSGSSQNVSHSLSAVPHVMIVKRYDDDGNYWVVYHHKNTSAPETDYLRLDGTGATVDDASRWDDTAPTSSVFTVKDSSQVNGSSNTYMNYLWTEKQGFSKFGSYTGNGNADGTFVYLGFKPAWLLIKRSSASGTDWILHDNKRAGFNVNDDYLAANTSAAEVTGNTYQNLDLLSNGFKMRGAGTGTNTDGATYIYMAFAEQPFVNSNGVPCNAR